FFCLSPEQKGETLGAALLLSWSKTFRVSGQAQPNEPCQHSTATSLRIAHYRPTSSVNEASVMKISRSRLTIALQCRAPGVDDSSELLAITKIVWVAMAARHQGKHRHHDDLDYGEEFRR